MSAARPRRHKTSSRSPSAGSDNNSLIARLSEREIAAMSEQELCEIVAGARLAFLQDETRLNLKDRETLERLVFLARRCCRNKVASARNGNCAADESGVERTMADAKPTSAHRFR